MSSVHDSAIDAVRQGILDLKLTGLTSQNIHLRKVPWDNINRPQYGVTLSPQVTDGSAETVEADGSNERDDIGYPIYVTMVMSTGKGWDQNRETMAEWRQKIWRTFHRKRLASFSVAGVNQIGCYVKPVTIHLPQQYVNDNLDVGQLLVRTWFRELRTP